MRTKNKAGPGSVKDHTCPLQQIYEWGRDHEVPQEININIRLEVHEGEGKKQKVKRLSRFPWNHLIKKVISLL